MARLEIYADFQNADQQGRIRLNCAGTTVDLVKKQAQLQEGLQVLLYCDDADVSGHNVRLEVEGTVTYSPVEQCWVAVIDWRQIRHRLDNSEMLVGKLDAFLRSLAESHNVRN